MALVVETGSGANPSANSYASLLEIREYNTARGRTLGADAEVEAQAVLAMDYIESHEADMLGWRTHGLDQPLSFPRENIIIAETYLGNDEIPALLKNAQAELAWQISEGVVLMPTISGQAVKRREVGPIKREFFAPPSTPTLPAVMAWLAPLLITTGFGNMRVVRV